MLGSLPAQDHIKMAMASAVRGNNHLSFTGVQTVTDAIHVDAVCCQLGRCHSALPKALDLPAISDEHPPVAAYHCCDTDQTTVRHHSIQGKRNV